MSFFKKAFLVNTTQFLSLILNLLQSVILSRVLGPGGIGKYTIFISALMLMAQWCSFGVPISFLYYSHNQNQNIKKYLMNAIWILLASGFLGGLVLVLVIIYNGDYFGSIPLWLMISIFLYMPIVLQRALSRNKLMVKIEARKLSVMSLFPDGLNIILILIFLLLSIIDVNLALLCFILTAAARAFLGWIWIYRDVDFHIKPSMPVCKNLLLMGVRQSWADLMIIVNGQISLYIIKYLIGDFESVGYFSRGLRVSMLVITATQAVLPLLFSKLASISQEDIPFYTEKVLRFLFTVSVFISAFMIVFSKSFIIILYGKEFIPAILPMIILVPGTLLYLISRTLIQLLGSRGRPELSASALFVSSALNGLMSWLLVSEYGIVGAAWAATLSNVFLLVFLLLIVRKKYGIKVKRSLLMRKSDISGIFNQMKRKKYV